MRNGHLQRVRNAMMHIYVQLVQFAKIFHMHHHHMKNKHLNAQTTQSEVNFLSNCCAHSSNKTVR